MFDLTGKTALVTGATGGIGAAIARTFHKAGASVAISGRQVEKLEALKAELGGERVQVVPCDLGDRAQVQKLIDEATKGLGGRLDILIEPINTFDMPGYFLTRTADAASVIATVGAPELALQLDLYHRARMEGAVADAIAEFSALARHYQIAGLPDRGEPWPSDLDYAPLLHQLAATGYDGWIGCEYRPRNGTAPGLGWLDRLSPCLAREASTSGA